MEKNKDKIDYKKTMWAALAFITIVGGTLLAYYFQEKNAEAHIVSCTRVTVAYPERFVPQSKLYYFFFLQGQKMSEGYTIPFPTMGKFERGRHLMNERFFVRVYCKDYSINRIYWDAKVPDTLQYIPKEGWKEIPYRLANEK